MAARHNAEKALKSNVLDDVTYTKKQVAGAYAGLIIGLWGVFFTTLVILFLCTRGVIPPFGYVW